MSNYEPLRPYRLERSDRRFGTTTFTSEEKARQAAAHYANRFNFGAFKPGTKWRITKRLNKSGSRVEVIADGTTDPNPAPTSANREEP